MANYEPLHETDREISLLIQAKFPLLSIITYEERRVLAQLEGIRQDVIDRRRVQLQQQRERATSETEKQTLDERLQRLDQAHQLLLWSYTSGVLHWSHYVQQDGQARHVPRPLGLPVRDSTNPVEVMHYLRNHPKAEVDGVDISTSLFVFCDLHPWLDREDRMGRFNYMLVRTLRDLVHIFKFSPEPRSILLLSPRAVVPLELNKDIQVIDYPLPTVEQLEQRFLAREPEMKRSYGEECIRLDDSARKRLMRALSGLTYDEAENVLAKCLANNRRLEEDDVAEALAEKRQIIRKDGTLEYFENNKDFDQVGGLELLQDWLVQRQMAFAGQVITLNGQKIPLPVPKGILLIGVPGGGKSLVAKAVAKAWELPLLRLDIGRIFGGIVGQSEENMRRAIRVAESVSPAVVWLDEVEKAFPKATGSSDSGVSLRVMSTFLTWMQEKKAPVFVVATGNDISQIPPELTRKGRFDEIFYVGLPDQEARQKIFEIHTRGFPISAKSYTYLAAKARCYTGAEIEQIVNNALFILPRFPALGANGTESDEPDKPLVWAIDECIAHFVPLARRKGKDGRGLLAETLDQARMLATPASAKFEELPGEGERVVQEKSVDESLEIYSSPSRF